MKKIIKQNLFLLGSLLFFLAVGAFTFLPKQVNANAGSMAMAHCFTCSFSGGIPDGCAIAQYCGFYQCIGNCELNNGICGDSGCY